MISMPACAMRQSRGGNDLRRDPNGTRAASGRRRTASAWSSDCGAQWPERRLGADRGDPRLGDSPITLICDAPPHYAYVDANDAATLDRRHLSKAVRHFPSVPTKKPRYTVTDSDVVSELLDQAQRRWPEVSDRKELLLRLAEVGREATEREGAARRAAVADTAGALSGVYESGELERLREDWPK